MKSITAILALAAGMTACFPVGAQIDEVRTLTPRGRLGDVVIRPVGRYPIEMLAVTDSSYIVESGSRIAEVPFVIVADLSLKGFGFLPGGKPQAEMLDRVRRAARFPYGISAEAMDALLKKAGHSSLERLGPCEEETTILKQIREATARYRDATVAEQDGYRRIGQDFPAMGEHWISLKVATADVFDPKQPSILLYARKGERLELVGAAFTALLDPGETVPGPACLSARWHEHAGTLDEELFATDHAQHGGSDRFKVLVLHAWTQLEHARDAFAVENWRLPFLRENLSLSDNEAAARALALVSNAGYYEAVIMKLGVPETDRPNLRALIETYRNKAIERRTNPAALARLWEEFGDAVAEKWPQAKL
jgi:hypothetical protein